MRYLVLTDIHANAQALDAVLADARRTGYDAVLVLGDLVGYGADPGYAIATVRALAPQVMIRGNHDKVCSGLEPPTHFNDAALRSVDWTQSTLTADETTFLRELPAGPKVVTRGVEVCHGAPQDEDQYILQDRDATAALRAVTERLCLFGHTHIPAIYAATDDPFVALDRRPDEYVLPRRSPGLVNVGSVGQPRDGDPRAAYGVLDTARDSITLRRVLYDVAAAQRRIRDAGLPDWLAVRLGRGQ